MCLTVHKSILKMLEIFKRKEISKDIILWLQDDEIEDPNNGKGRKNL
jgi:hypothetical protein